LLAVGRTSTRTRRCWTWPQRRTHRRTCRSRPYSMWAARAETF
jgi:hypothetical protein